MLGANNESLISSSRTWVLNLRQPFLADAVARFAAHAVNPVSFRTYHCVCVPGPYLRHRAFTFESQVRQTKKVLGRG
jgi:hypothetical protein